MLENAIEIVGAGTNATVVQMGTGVTFAGGGVFRMRDLTMEIVEDRELTGIAQDVLVVESGTFDLRGVRVRGAKYHPQMGSGAGIRIEGGARGVVEDSLVELNGLVGIIVRDGFDITLRNNRIVANGADYGHWWLAPEWYGLGGNVRGDYCASAGVWIYGEGRVRVTGNTIEGNLGFGISFGHAVVVDARDNTVASNGRDAQGLACQGPP